MDKVLLVGTSFAQNGQGVPDMNYTFRKYLSKQIPLESIDIYELSRRQFPRLNIMLAKNLYLIKIKQKIEKKFIHVMHQNDICNTLPLINYSKYSQNKIITVHDFYPLIIRPRRDTLTKFDNFLKGKCFKFLSSYDHIFARTREISIRLQNDYNIGKEKITVQGPIIEYSYLQSNIIKKTGDKIIIGYVNNFNWNKSEKLQTFIEIFKNIRSKELEFHIYGSGFPFLDKISQDNRIRYYGFVPEAKVPSVIAGFDVYLSTSTYEGFGIPIAKAKAMKIPVLCFNGNIPEITKSNTCLWDEHNLGNVIKNEEWKNVNLSAAYNDISNLSPEAVIKQTVEIYNKIFGSL